MVKMAEVFDEAQGGGYRKAGSHVLKEKIYHALMMQIEIFLTFVSG